MWFNAIGSIFKFSHARGTIASINTPYTLISQRFCPPSTSHFPEAKLSSTSLSSISWKYSKTFHQQPENIQRLFINNPKTFKDFSSTTRKNSKTFHQQPENIQRLFINNRKIFKDFSSTTRKHSKTFHQQPEKTQRLFINNPKTFKDFSSTTGKYSKTFSPAELS